MLEKINGNQLALKLGISRQAVSQAIQNETLPIIIENGKKKIDLSNPKVQDYIKQVKENRKEKSKIKQPVKVKKQKKSEKTKAVAVSNPKLPEKKKSIKEDKFPAHIIKKLDEGKLKASELIELPKVTVEKIKLYEMTKQVIQKREQERRELISAKLFRLLLGKLFEIHINEFLTIKSKSVAEIAGIFGSTDEAKKLKAEKILDGELWEVLKHIKIEFNKFLAKTGNEPIK